jgi:hypothetical protein
MDVAFVNDACKQMTGKLAVRKFATGITITFLQAALNAQSLPFTQLANKACLNRIFNKKRFPV